MSDPETETVHIGEEDLDELSEEATEELVEIGAIKYTERTQYKNRSKLQQLKPNADASHTTVKDLLKKYASQKIATVKDWTYKSINYFISSNKRSNISSTKTYCGQITNVIPHTYSVRQNVIELTVEGPDEKHRLQTIRLKQGSTEYANLLNYHGISNNPSDLKGKYLSIDSPDTTNPTYRIPHNTATIGKLQYKISGYLNYISSTHESENEDLGFLCGLLAGVLFCVSLVSIGKSEFIFSAILMAIIVPLLVVWFKESYLFFVGGLNEMFDTEFETLPYN